VHYYYLAVESGYLILVPEYSYIHPIVWDTYSVFGEGKIKLPETNNRMYSVVCTEYCNCESWHIKMGHVELATTDGGNL
jgi:hypothetical protein